MYFNSVAIAVNDTEDTRPVLDYYKEKGGEDRVLETFKIQQAQLRTEEEERNQEVKALRNRSTLGKISPYSLWGRKGSGSQETVSICSRHDVFIINFSFRLL